MGLNKFFGAILFASIMAMVSGFIADSLYDPEEADKVKRGYQIEVAEVSGAGAAPVEEAITMDKIKELMQVADVEAGKKFIKTCMTCHTFEKAGPNRVGPNLWNIVGNKKAIHPAFSYSTALKDQAGNWDYESLFHFLHKPRKFIPGTKMTYVGIGDPKDIANVIAYMRSMSDIPVSLP